MREQTREPFFITPKTMSDMSDDDLISLLERVRENRLRYVEIYKEKERMKQEARVEKVRDKVEKQFAMLGKEIERMDKVYAALDKRVTNIRALRVELDMELI